MIWVGKNPNTEHLYLMYQDGLSLEQIGKIFNMSRQSVYERFAKNGLKLRSLKKKPFIIVDGYKFTINRDGYYECTTIDRLMLHNLIWEKHNGLIPDGHEIHHKDKNKINNNISNLQLVTPQQHTKIHATEIGGSGMNKKVRCVETGKIYHSIVALAKETNQHASNVSRYYIDGRRKLNGLTYEKI